MKSRKCDFCNSTFTGTQEIWFNLKRVALGKMSCLKCLIITERGVGHGEFHSGGGAARVC